ncbi:MAG: DNA-formamidopyrimidine glycosylase [Candidatus Pacebacteria bacterium]|nr:DNA-formamidopyrimidine glycosylase [Candidatus Paceibacterota bacterium]
MPELPEVETIVAGLDKKVLGRTFVDVWTDWQKIIKFPKNFLLFKKEITGQKIKKIWRRGKNIIFDLSGEKSLLIHQKLTGHLLFGKWDRKNNFWEPENKGPLAEDPKNRFLHVIFFLDNKSQLALSDLRKFAKIELRGREELINLEELKNLGPEPLDSNFTFEKFKSVLPKKGKIKQVLMDQNIIAGIGNIYSDEILWEAKVLPFRNAAEITEAEFLKIYKAIKKILKKAVKLKGDSFSDFRTISGELGGYQKIQKAYGREGKPCFRKDGGIIKRQKIGGRSAHFCPVCQK